MLRTHHRGRRWCSGVVVGLLCYKGRPMLLHRVGGLVPWAWRRCYRRPAAVLRLGRRPCFNGRPALLPGVGGVATRGGSPCTASDLFCYDSVRERKHDKIRCRSSECSISVGVGERRRCAPGVSVDHIRDMCRLPDSGDRDF
jgi:hypothetical protein